MHACMHAPDQLHVYEREVSEVILIRILAQAILPNKNIVHLRIVANLKVPPNQKHWFLQDLRKSHTNV